jgi:MSHA biogenesis protein MshL
VTTTQTDPRTGTIVQTATTPATVNEGVVLDVTPHASEDGIITMNIHPTVTERTGAAVSPQGDSVPIVDVRETDTIVRVLDGETIAIAGLISTRSIKNFSKVPIIGDLPLIGPLFKRTSVEKDKTDFAVLITPRIMTLKTALDYTRSRIEEQDKLKKEQEGVR